MIIGECAIVDHGRDVGVLVVVGPIVVAIGVCYDCKTCHERISLVQGFSIAYTIIHYTCQFLQLLSQQRTNINHQGGVKSQEC